MNTPFNPLDLRIGEGWDTHQLVAGRPLVLGGVTVPHSHGLLGHIATLARPGGASIALCSLLLTGPVVGRVPLHRRCWAVCLGCCAGW